MLRNVLYAILLTTFVNSIGIAQKTNESVTDSVKPETDIKVNKEYDEKGNLIRYDSTYISYHFNKDFNIHNLDSMLSNFGFKSDFFSDSTFGKFDFNFGNLFPLEGFELKGHLFNDSTFMRGFFSPEYFEKNFKINMDMLEELFKNMDSIKESTNDKGIKKI